MRISKLLLAFALAGAPSLAHAHGKEGHQAAGPNGGQLVTANGHHVEFVVKDENLIFYVTDEANKPETTKDAVASVTLQSKGKPAIVPLSPAEPNQLTAKLEPAVAAGVKLVISAKLSGGHDLQARFVSK